MCANYRVVTSTVVTYYSDNHQLPIFEGQQEYIYTVEQLVLFLLGDATSEEACKSQPMGVKSVFYNWFVCEKVK